MVWIRDPNIIREWVAVVKKTDHRKFPSACVPKLGSLTFFLLGIKGPSINKKGLFLPSFPFSLFFLLRFLSFGGTRIKHEARNAYSHILTNSQRVGGRRGRHGGQGQRARAGKASAILCWMYSAGAFAHSRYQSSIASIVGNQRQISAGICNESRLA